jgi:pyruvate kinase
MALPYHKTKLVCTIGPASDSQPILEQMILAGMNVARINFSHGDFAGHAKVIQEVRAAARSTGRRIAIMADLPGPKIRIGKLASEPIDLNQGDELTLTTNEIVGDANRISVSFQALPSVVKPGDAIFLNDGYIQLEVLKSEGTETRCRVLVGGELRSHKGLNLPQIDLGISVFTDHDRECLKCALEAGVDAVSQSFVQSAADIAEVRAAAADLGYDPFVIAKIERSKALNNIDAILRVADGIMIARGDLGVEIPIERISLVQKDLIKRANLLGKPVITATQMLESMISNRRPTRAESTDVANAILDGTDCVMLSGESAMGAYPVDSVSMLGKIASVVEPRIQAPAVRQVASCPAPDDRISFTDLITLSVSAVVDHASPAVVFVPTKSGATARSISRFKLPVWIVAVSRHETTCQRLQFSYGVYSEHQVTHPEDWRAFSRSWLAEHGITGRQAVVTEGPSTDHPEGNHRVEIIDLGNST